MRPLSGRSMAALLGMWLKLERDNGEEQQSLGRGPHSLGRGPHSLHQPGRCPRWADPAPPQREEMPPPELLLRLLEGWRVVVVVRRGGIICILGIMN